MKKQYYVYILRNTSGTFYIGVTGNISLRMWQHKNKTVKGFTTKYNIDKLIYVETYDDINDAIAREKQLKNWSRRKKINLIIKVNPRFQEVVIGDPSTPLRSARDDKEVTRSARDDRKRTLGRDDIDKSIKNPALCEGRDKVAQVQDICRQEYILIHL